MKKTTIRRQILLSVPILLVLIIAVQIACKKTEPCDNSLCQGAFSCVDGECGCAYNGIKVGGIMCAFPKTNPFMALPGANGLLPELFLLQFSDLDSAIIGTGFETRDLRINAPIYNSNPAFTSYSIASRGPDGLVGDEIRFGYAYRVYPGGPGGGQCDLIVNGVFTHPDTLEASMWMSYCSDPDMPEYHNKYRAVFARIKQP